MRRFYKHGAANVHIGINYGLDIGALVVVVLVEIHMFGCDWKLVDDAESESDLDGEVLFAYNRHL